MKIDYNGCKNTKGVITVVVTPFIMLPCEYTNDSTHYA